jgi:hypothetical protein
MGHQGKDQITRVQFLTDPDIAVFAAHPYLPIHLSSGYQMIMLWAKVAGE